MKVVLFCGGQGMRLREYSDHIPKPMVPVGPRPILWHLMKYYAHYGHHDFILCLGHKGDVIKDYFLNYKEAVSNDFVLSDGGRNVQLLNSDIDNWNITFCDTGITANIGERLLAVREHLEGQEVFMANYADNLTDLPLPTLMTHFRMQDKIATFLAVKPSASFHVVQINDDQTVYDLTPTSETDIWINGGYFIFKQEIFNHINDGEELVLAPFQRLMQKRQLTAYQHKGFWACMDTYKEKQTLDELHARGNAPWQVWNKRAASKRPIAGVPR